MSFTRGETTIRHTFHGTPACLAHHMFVRLPLLERVDFEGERGHVVIRIRLHRRAWWRLGFAHRRALRLARYVAAVHVAAGIVTVVRLA